MLTLYTTFYPNLYYQPDINYGDHNSTIGFGFVEECNPGRVLQEAYYEGDDDDDYFEED